MTLAAIEYVGPPEGLVDVLGGLERLVEHSLVQTVAETAGGTRFRMLETIREFGLERLESLGEEIATRYRHLGFFLDLTEQAALELTGPEQVDWLDRLEAEHDNLRAALSSATNLPNGSPGLLLTAALAQFWEARGHDSEGREWLERMVASGAKEPMTARAAVLTGTGRFAGRVPGPRYRDWGPRRHGPHSPPPGTRGRSAR
jgi:predicted ATPase